MYTPTTRAVLYGLLIHFTEGLVDLFLVSRSGIETEAVHRIEMGKPDQMDYSNLLQTAMTFGRSRTMR